MYEGYKAVLGAQWSLFPYLLIIRKKIPRSPTILFRPLLGLLARYLLFCYSGTSLGRNGASSFGSRLGPLYCGTNRWSSTSRHRSRELRMRRLFSDHHRRRLDISRSLDTRDLSVSPNLCSHPTAHKWSRRLQKRPREGQRYDSSSALPRDRIAAPAEDRLVATQAQIAAPLLIETLPEPNAIESGHPED
jgi:hypothetical protein